ncbi:MAG: ABC transporter substrate binding protein [Chloroflexota bacterium]
MKKLKNVSLLCALFLFLVGCQLDNQQEIIYIDSGKAETTESSGQDSEKELVADSDWLNLDQQLSDNWEFKAANDVDGLLASPVQIRPIGEAEGDSFEIIAIFSKKSSAYDTALNSMLTLFQGRGIPAEILVLNGENEGEIIESAYAHAQSENPDLILSFGSKATAWIHDNDTKGTIPVLSVTSKDPVLMGQVTDYESGSGTHIAYTSLNIPIELQLSYLKQFRPELKTIGILYAENNSSAVVTQVDPLVEAAEADGIEIVHFVVKDQGDAQAELEAMMPNLIEQMTANDPDNQQSILWITGSTSVFNEIQTINQHADDIPILSVVTDVTTAGENSAMLSIGVSFESNALMAAIFAERILNGEAAGDLPVGVVTPPDIAINFSKAAASGVNIPFTFFESANFIYDMEEAQVRAYGQ